MDQITDREVLAQGTLLAAVRVSSEPVKVADAKKNEASQQSLLEQVEQSVKADSKASEVEVREVAEAIENSLNASGTTVRFNVSAEENSFSSITFKVIDQSTGEVVREFPSEEVKRLAEKAKEQSVQGILIDEQA